MHNTPTYFSYIRSLVCILATFSSAFISGCQSKNIHKAGDLSSEQNAQKISLLNFDPKQIGKSNLSVTKDIESKARLFLKEKNLIKPDEEMAEGRVVTKWGIYETARYGSTDLLIMSNMLSYDGARPEPQNAWEVIAYKQSQFYLIEDLFQIPKELIVGIGEWFNFDGNNKKILPPDLYYVKLRAPSSIAFTKAMLAHLNYAGLSADITTKGGKEAFDPTPNRTWRLDKVIYDLRRGSTAEIHDVYPAQLDDDFETYYEGSAGHVAPWNAGVRRVFLNNKWIDLVEKL